MKKIIISILLMSLKLSAVETDQYMTWGIELKDSANVVNEYISTELRNRLKLPKIQKQKTCFQVIKKSAKIFRRPFVQLIESWAEHNLEIDIYPPRSFEGSYKNLSIYRKNVFPFIMPLSSTMNINGIYFGTDKIGHFISFGIRYMSMYQKYTKRGLSHDQAIRKLVKFGINSEIYLVGTFATGVVSFADMEANFQGFLFFSSLCNQNSDFHYKQDKSGRWKLIGELDIRKHITPEFDESYNENHFRSDRWTGKKGLSVTLKKYCGLTHNFTRKSYYQKNFTKSFNIDYISELEKNGELTLRKSKNFSKLCRE